jgi:hypothetical protein
MLDVFNPPIFPAFISHFFVSTMDCCGPSSARARATARLEHVGEDRKSPEPNPFITRRSEELEDKYVPNTFHSAQYLHRVRFLKACHQKGQWINVAICFGVDLQEVFKVGIRSDMQNLDADVDNDYDDADNYPNM